MAESGWELAVANARRGGMEDARHVFDEARRLQADAVGEPGNRRFRLLVEDGHRSACLWLEKEQLQALGLAIDQQFSPLSIIWPRAAVEIDSTAKPAGFTESPTIEFQIGSLAIATDEGASEFGLIVHDADTKQEGPATLVCRASRAQMRSLSREISALVNAGRPRCPLCGQPIEGDRHPCPNAN
jgi:uncharacterized repeat protein (TIGR03847 family)